MSKTLLVASAGGHLAELYRLRPRLPDSGNATAWITVDHPHARSLLQGEEAYFVPDAPSRNLAATFRNAILSRSLLHKIKPDWVVSNGASLAVSVLPQAAAAGIPCCFIENSVRVDGPSLTGRILRWAPGVDTFTQYADWSNAHWPVTGSVLDEWVPIPQAPKPISRIVVTVGTTEWPFRRLFQRLATCLPPTAQILWQHGATSLDGLEIRGVEALDARDLAQEIAACDLVVAHAGIGSAIAAFEAGKMPLLVPRRAQYGEAVDDHQVDVGRQLEKRGLCIFSEVESITEQHLKAASALAVRAHPNPPLLELASGGPRHRSGPYGS